MPQADADSGDDSDAEKDDLAIALEKLKLGDRNLDTQDAVPWTTVETQMGHEKGDMLVAYSTVKGQWLGCVSFIVSITVLLAHLGYCR